MELTIRLKRGSSSDWCRINPILAAGEAGIELDTHKFKFGDGITPWNALQYASITPNTSIQAGTHTKITYDSQGLVIAGSDITLADVKDITATAVELNILDGATISTTELNYLNGTVAPLQSQIGLLSNLTTADKTNLIAAINEVNNHVNVDGTTLAVSGDQLQLKNSAGTVLSFVIRAFVFEQGTPATEWIIEHNLDKYPSYSVVDSAGNTVEVAVNYVNRNKLILKMNSAFSGKAYLS